MRIRAHQTSTFTHYYITLPKPYRPLQFVYNKDLEWIMIAEDEKHPHVDERFSKEEKQKIEQIFKKDLEEFKKRYHK